MSTVNRSHGRTLRTWSSAVFIGAGGVLLGYAALYGLEVLGEAEYPTVQAILLASGYAVGFVGLLGLYPGSVKRASTVTRLAAVAAGAALVGWLVLLAVGVGVIAVGLPSESALLPSAFFVVHPVTMILAYGLFAVAVLRTGSGTRTTGVALLVPAVLVVALLVGGLVRPGRFPFGAFVISCGQGMAHLAVGYSLRTDADSAEAEDRSGEELTGVSAHD